MNRTINIQIEELSNGYLVNGYTQGNVEDETPFGATSNFQRTYAKDWDDVGEIVAEFIIDNG